MEIKTKYQLGQTLWTIIGNKATTFTVAAIIIEDDGIRYGKSPFCGIPEAHCFESKDELIKYVLGDGE